MQYEVHKGVRVKSSEYMRSRGLTNKPRFDTIDHIPTLHYYYLINAEPGLWFDVCLC
jgi:hypothetical protein